MIKMKKITISVVALALALTSCENVVEGLNKNPNAIEIDDIDAGLYVNTPELALVSVVRGLNGRMASLWTGQIIGVANFPLAYYNYQLTESTFDFDGYSSVITQCKHIQQSEPDNGLYQGLTRVLGLSLQLLCLGLWRYSCQGGRYRCGVSSL
jgi:hypothetical protein